MAVRQGDGSYKLHGFKWFTSATDADMTLTLARVQDGGGSTTQVLHLSLRSSFEILVSLLLHSTSPHGTQKFQSLLTASSRHTSSLCVCLVPSLQGSRGLSLFYAEVSRDQDGLLRGIEVQRLKDKLGTRQMPTAELLLDGLPAHKVRATPHDPPNPPNTRVHLSLYGGWVVDH